VDGSLDKPMFICMSESSGMSAFDKKHLRLIFISSFTYVQG